MKKILKLLITLAIATPTSLNVSACGGSSENPSHSDEDGTDMTKLLTLAETNISTQFATLITNNKNLTYENSFDNGDKIKEKIAATTNEKVIEDPNDPNPDPDPIVKTAFLKLISNHIKNHIIPALQEQRQLSSLFYGINTNDILKLNFNASTITKKQFDTTDSVGPNDWKFGIKGYTRKKYKIEWLYKLDFNLDLTLQHNNFTSHTITRTIKQKISFYFGNKGADLNKFIDDSSSKISQLFPKNDGILVKNENNNNDIPLIEKEAKKIIQEKIKASSATVNSLIVNPTLLTTLCYDQSASNFHNEPLYTDIPKRIYEAQSVPDAEKILKSELNGRLRKYKDSLNKWVTGKITTGLYTDRIFIFGTIEINDWSIGGLALKPLIVNVIEIRTKMTQKDWVSKNSNAIAAMWNKNGLISKDNRITMGNDLTIKLNPSTFDQLITQNLTTVDAWKLISKSLRKIAINKQLIDSTTPFSMNFNSWHPENQFVLKDKQTDATTISLPESDWQGNNLIWWNSDSVHMTVAFKQHLKQWSRFDNIYLKKADTNIW